MLRTAILVLTVPVILLGQEEHVRKSIPVDSATRFVLDVDSGAIQVEPGTGSTIEIEADLYAKGPFRTEFDRIRKDFSLQVSRQGPEIRVRGEFREEWRRALRRVEFRVKLPAQMAVDLHTRGGSIDVGDRTAPVTSRTSGGSLHFGRIDGPVNGTTAGGSITLLRGKGKSVLRTSGGSIHIEEAAGDVEAYTSGGSIDILRTMGQVVAHTSGGSIHVGHAANSVDAETSGGGIHVAMVPTAAFEVDAATRGGGVSSDFTVSGTVQRNSLRGAVNGGGPLLRLRTSGGGIQIRRAS